MLCWGGEYGVKLLGTKREVGDRGERGRGRGRGGEEEGEEGEEERRRRERERRENKAEKVDGRGALSWVRKTHECQPALTPLRVLYKHTRIYL